MQRNALAAVQWNVEWVAGSRGKVKIVYNTVDLQWNVIQCLLQSIELHFNKCEMPCSEMQAGLAESRGRGNNGNNIIETSEL